MYSKIVSSSMMLANFRLKSGRNLDTKPGPEIEKMRFKISLGYWLLLKPPLHLDWWAHLFRRVQEIFFIFKNFLH